MIASVTRLRLRSVMYFPSFVWNAFLIQRQAARAEGFVGGRVLQDAKWTFWTLTVWENESAMRKFRGAGAHGKVMARLADWCDEASYAHWSTATEGVPEWLEAYEHLVNEGKLSRVMHPSADHEARRFTKPQPSRFRGQELRQPRG